MNINHVAFIESQTDWQKAGLSNFPEFTFCGRSNVGKSSLINYLTNRKNIAHSSSKPGKTQTLNLFQVDKRWNIMDVPGYGYAKTSKTNRENWNKMIRAYFLNRPNLVNIFLLVDSSIPPVEKDLAFCEWLGSNQLPFSLIFTKTDKGRRNSCTKNIEQFKAKLKENWEVLPPIFLTSVTKKEGREDILAYIESSLQSVEKA